MTIYSPAQIAAIWTGQGGPPAKALYAVAVALAESGGNSTAVSPSDDHGLWQINRMHFAEYAVNDQTVLDPAKNAQIAISLSVNGSNWGPWCTAYAPGSAPCGSLYLPAPQTGSPAADQLARAAGGVGTVGPVASGAVPSAALPRIEQAWASFGGLLGSLGRAIHGNITNAGNAMRGL